MTGGRLATPLDWHRRRGERAIRGRWQYGDRKLSLFASSRQQGLAVSASAISSSPLPAPLLSSSHTVLLLGRERDRFAESKREAAISGCITHGRHSAALDTLLDSRYLLPVPPPPPGPLPLPPSHWVSPWSSRPRFSINPPSRIRAGKIKHSAVTTYTSTRGLVGLSSSTSSAAASSQPPTASHRPAILSVERQAERNTFIIYIPKGIRSLHRPSPSC